MTNHMRDSAPKHYRRTPSAWEVNNFTIDLAVVIVILFILALVQVWA